MIRSLSGTVISIDEESICLDVAGFGIEIFVTGTLLSSAVVGGSLRCLAYLQISDSGMAMFGFSSETERALFLELTQVKTMGGKLSITLLRRLSAQDVITAIMSSDPSRLSVPGLGAKRAERICFELRSKIEKKFPSLSESGAQINITGSADGEVIGGLMGLGFSQAEASRAVALCRSESGDSEWTEEDLMMSALNRLQRR